jgi:hypothetical protein
MNVDLCVGSFLIDICCVKEGHNKKDVTSPGIWVTYLSFCWTVK